MEKELEKLLAKGLSTRKIALLVGISQSQVSILIHRYNLSPAYKFNQKGNKRQYNPSNESANQKRSEALRGRYFPHKNGNYHPAETRSCHTCGKLISVVGSRRNQKNNYCSAKCLSITFKTRRSNNFKGGPQKVRCTWCNKELIRSYTAATQQTRFFCNQKCAGSWKSKYLVGGMVYNWKGRRKPYYGENWIAMRKLCREKDKNTCQVCGKDYNILYKNTDVDHVKPFNDFNHDYILANNLNNLWCLCHSCHSIKSNYEKQGIRMIRDEWKIFIEKKKNRQ